MRKKKKNSKKTDKANNEVIRKEPGISNLSGSQVRIDLGFSNDVSLSSDDLI